MPKPPPIESNQERKKRSSAWGLAIANQLALPGLGTVMAGRRIGYLQLLFSVSGVVLTTAFLFWSIPNLRDWLPPPEDETIVLANFEKWKPWFLIAGLGIVLFFTGWCLALFSSQSIVRKRGTTADP